jgi:hypothetical protein
MNEDTPENPVDDPLMTLVEVKLGLIDIAALLDLQIRRGDALGENYPLATEHVAKATQ